MLNEDIPVNKWQENIKHVELGRNDVLYILTTKT